MISRCVTATLAALAAVPAMATTVTTPINTWNGSTGYVFGRPIVASTGVVYGVLAYGTGTSTGSVYALTPVTGGTTYTTATISAFTGGTGGGNPSGKLYLDGTGHLYGATLGGGYTGINECKYSGYSGCGLVYELTAPTSGNTWTRTTLYTFQGGTDGNGPVGDLVADSNGALYGVTVGGGCTATLTYPNGCGVVFKLTPPVAPKTTWTESVLYRFAGGPADGAVPMGPLAIDSSGDIFGATMFGGPRNCSTYSGSPDAGCGVVFELINNAGVYSETVLHGFTDGADGSLPGGGVVLDSKGNVYGTTLQGGAGGLCLNFGYSGCGLVFKYTKPTTGTTWARSTPVTFSGANGATPGILIIDSKNHLFGITSDNTTAYSGCTQSYYCGTVFKLAYAKSKWTTTTLSNFTAANSIAHPEFGLASDSTGNLYGVTESDVTSAVIKVTGSTFVPPLAGAFRRP